MGGVLLTVDWDYFMPYMKEWKGSYAENKSNILKHWYRTYIESYIKGIDITKSMDIGGEEKDFWDNIVEKFQLENVHKIVVSESHEMAYEIAKEGDLREIYSFDAHSDLGYGGIESLNFEVNCANWLGKLFRDGLINEANIIYSPYSAERAEDFKEINERFNIKYPT